MYPNFRLKKRHIPLLIAAVCMEWLRRSATGGGKGPAPRIAAVVCTLLGLAYALSAFLPQSTYEGVGLAAARPTPPIALAVGIAIALAGLAAFPLQARKYSRLAMQTGIVLLGFWISLAQVAAAGLTGLLLSTGAVAVALAASLALSRLLRTPAETGTLLAAGTAICGGSAIAATGTVIRASAAAMAVSTAIVFLLNACGVFAYPAIGHALQLSQAQFGAWSAIGVHDVAGVVAASKAYGPQALADATVIKLTRVLWIIPTALLLARAYRSAPSAPPQAQQPSAKGRWSILTALPAFVFLFLAACLARAALDWSLGADAVAPTADAGKSIATGLMTLALFLIGLGLSRDALRQVGWRPALHGVALWLVVSVTALFACRALLD